MVLDGERLAGIFSNATTPGNGIIHPAWGGRKAKSTPVAEVMTHNVFTVSGPTMTRLERHHPGHDAPWRKLYVFVVINTFATSRWWTTEK